MLMIIEYFVNQERKLIRVSAYLANTLYSSHGLTLQAQKTKILSSQEFIDQILETEEQKEILALVSRFDNIVDSLGLLNPYDPIDFMGLDPGIQAKIDGMNLEALLEDQLCKEEIDIPTTKFLINRLGQIRRTEPLDNIISSIDHLHPIYSEVIRYLSEIGEDLSVEIRYQIGAKLLGKLRSSVLSSLEYNKMQVMSLFAGSDKWGNSEKLNKFYNDEFEAFFRRTVILALGRSNQDYCLRPKKNDLEQMTDWNRRAFLYAASCLPSDEMKHWYGAVLNTRDELEKYVISWAKTNPIISN